jgi:hypothetical protein
MKYAIAALIGAALLAPELPMLPPARCAAAADTAHCEAAQPKSWTDDERITMRAAIERLSANELARGIVAGAVANGYRGLHRYVTDTQRHVNGGYETKFGPGFVLYAAKVIGVTDAYFWLAEMRDPRAGYRVADVVLLHELIHAYDDRERSIDREFTALAGWKFENGRWAYQNRVSWSAYNGVYAETLTLYARARYADAWERDRTFATSLAFPLPRIQSLVTPAEAFADILSHLILDPTSRDYLAPSMVEWFERRVFPALRKQGADVPLPLHKD